MSGGRHKPDDYERYSSTQEIRERFDNDVERFSSLETGQAAAMDSPLCTRLIAQAAALLCPSDSTAISVLDVGCGAGNYTLTFLQEMQVRGRGTSDVNVTLLDLSHPMLDRAAQRVGERICKTPMAMQGDLRDIVLGEKQFDVILAAAVLHHLRDEQQWGDCFAKLFASLKPGGSLWVYDMVTFDEPVLDMLMRQQYMDYLETLGGVEYRQKVCAYIQKEDTPRSLAFQMRCMTQAGFESAVVLHANAVFAAFGARRPAE